MYVNVCVCICFVASNDEKMATVPGFFISVDDSDNMSGQTEFRNLGFLPGQTLPNGDTVPPRPSMNGVPMAGASASRAHDSHAVSPPMIAMAAGVSTVVIGAVAVLVLRLRRQSLASAAEQPKYEALA